MNIGGRRIDHIVYAVPDLIRATNWFEEKMGVRPVIGGKHQTKGTKNALLHLGEGCYLEILAVDHENDQIPSPRWMGIDLIDVPQMTRWCLKSTNLEKDATILQKYNTDMGLVQGGQRAMTNGDLLTWEMILPLSEPIIEIVPFMTDWQGSKFHPTTRLEEQCQLIEMGFIHTNPRELSQIFNDLNLDINVVKGENTILWADIQTPKGIVRI